MINELFEKRIIKENQAKKVLGGGGPPIYNGPGKDPGTIGEKETLVQTIWPWLTKDSQFYTD